MPRKEKEEVKAAPEPEPATREELIALAESMNTVLQLDPPITITKKMKEDDIEALIIEQANGNVFEIDFTPDDNDDTVPFFSEEDGAIFDLLGIEIQPGSPPDPEAEAAPAPAKKGAAKKDEPAPAKGKGKETPAPAKKDAPAAKSKPTETKKNEPAYTRSDALVDSLEKGGTVEELVVLSDKLFCKENPDCPTGKTTSRSMLGYVLPTLKIIGYVAIDKNGVIKKAK